jgi:hypothetical protein
MLKNQFSLGGKFIIMISSLFLMQFDAESIVSFKITAVTEAIHMHSKTALKPIFIAFRPILTKVGLFTNSLETIRGKKIMAEKQRWKNALGHNF